MPAKLKLLSAELWMDSAIMALVDAAPVWLLAGRIKPARFRELK